MNTADAALATAGLAFLSVPLGAVVSARLRRRDKQQDWLRQDEVARRVTEEAGRVAAAAAALHEAAETQISESRAAAAATRTQLTQIQSTGEETRRFVDGAYTAQLRIELTVQHGFAAMTRTTLALIRAAGDTPAPEILKLLTVTEARISVLEPLIAERTAYMDNLAEVALAKINAGKDC